MGGEEGRGRRGEERGERGEERKEKGRKGMMMRKEEVKGTENVLETRDLNSCMHTYWSIPRNV